MTEELTFTMIKPDAVEKKHMASILSLIANAGFEIIAIKMKKLKLKEAESFYGIHKEQPFFSNLISFITRGPVVVAVLKKIMPLKTSENLLEIQTLKKPKMIQLEKDLQLQ